MTLDERIRENLQQAARSVEGGQPEPAEVVVDAGRRRRSVRAIAWSAVGGAAVLTLAWGVANQLNTTRSEVDGPAATTPSEVVGTEEFDVVQGKLGPEPRFDTSQLGPEVTLDPVVDVSTAIEEAKQSLHGEILRLMLIGVTSSGEVVTVSHHIETSLDGGEMQMRCLFTGSGGGCGGAPVSELGPDELLAPDTTRLDPSIHAGNGRATFEWNVPGEVSVAMLTANGSRQWARPIGGVAVFEADWVPEGDYRLTFFDENGKVTRRHRHPSEVLSGFRCPVTVPTQPDFSPPDGYPDEARVGDGYFGSANLWTVLPIDGAYQPRKSVWWSQNFPGGSEEEQPAIKVSWTRLDDDSALQTSIGGTNARTAEDGDFMIAGIDPDEPGCWEVTAEYKGETLRYVYERR